MIIMMLTTSGKEFSTYLTCYTPFVSSITGVVYVFFSQYQRGKVESNHRVLKDQEQRKPQT